MADSVAIVISLSLLVLFFRYVVFAGPSQRSTATPRAAQTAPYSRSSARLRPVSPEKVDTVLSMFPAFPRSVIETDLARTGSVEQTCENILSGRLVPPPVQEPAPSSSGSSSPSIAHNTALQSLKASGLNVGAPITEPIKKWEETPEARERNLRARKEFMLRQARQKLLEKQTQAAGSSTKAD